MIKTNNDPGPMLSRKAFLKGSAAAVGLLAAGGGIGISAEAEAASGLALRTIPKSGEKIPIIGVGTAWIYDVMPDDPKMPILRSTLDIFTKAGGRVIDTSPTYGRAEPVVGQLLAELGARDKAFIATKISTFGEQEGVASVKSSMSNLRTNKFELLQVHNIKDTKTQLKSIRRLREEGNVRYIGITVSSKRRYERFIKVMETEPLDFVQVNYSLGQPQTAERILPLARDQGMAVLINRPFWKGRLFRKAKGHRLPDWAADFDCKSWAQFFLKFSLSHEAVTCAIPGTDRPEYMTDNLAGGMGRMPDKKTQAKMLAFWQNL